MMQAKKTYLVGGAVRDQLLGLKSVDRDYVCVGYTHEDMIGMGFTQVGADFPVYLHPATREEYALARTEVSTGDGHKDFDLMFSPDVTIEEDLRRRDFTINAIAYDIETGEYIDPYGGMEDLKNKLLRTVTPNSLVEDPLRIYRLFRFFARYGGEFSIGLETLLEVYDAKGGLSALPKERKFAELVKCMMYHSGANKPSLMVDLLCDIGEMPEVEALRGIPQPVQHHPEGDAYVHTMLCLDYSHATYATPQVQWAVLCHALGKVCFREFGNLHGHEEYGRDMVLEMSHRFGVPKYWHKLADVVCKNHTRLHRIFDMTPKKVYDLLFEVGGTKDQENFMMIDFIDACVADVRGRGPTKMHEDYFQPLVLSAACEVLQNCRVYISEQSKEMAEKFRGRPDVIRDKVRAMKVGYVARAIAERKKELKVLIDERGEDGEIQMYKLKKGGGIIK